MVTGRTASRIALALEGETSSPLVAGLTFAPPDALAAGANGCEDVAGRLVAACHALALDFVFVPASAPWAADVARSTDGCGVMWVVDGPLWPVLSARSLGEGLKATIRDPESLRADLDRETERGRNAIRQGLSLGVDAVVVAEDLAGRDGPFVTPEYAQAEVFSRLAVLARTATSGGARAILHSDGDVTSLLPSIRNASFSAVHGGGGLGREGFERLFWEARRQNVAVIGGVATASLQRGSFAAVNAGTRIALLAQTGGLLIADDGGITTGEEIDAFAVALGAARGMSAPTPESPRRRE